MASSWPIKSGAGVDVELGGPAATISIELDMGLRNEDADGWPSPWIWTKPKVLLPLWA
jgi:hypothetical protein